MTNTPNPINDTQACRFCGETIKAIAKKCRFCGSILDEEWGRSRLPGNDSSAPGRLLIPADMPVSAIIDGYCGLLSIAPIYGIPFQIAAIACGIAALKKLKKNRGLIGAYRAWFGIIFGVFWLLYWGLLMARFLFPNTIIEPV